MSIGGFEFEPFAKELNLGKNGLFRAMDDFNTSLINANNGEGLSRRAIENMRDDNRISMRRTKTRAWLVAFIEDRQRKFDDLSDEVANELIRQIGEASNERRDAGGNTITRQSDLEQFTDFLQDFRNENGGLMRQFDSFAGAYSIIRRTTRYDQEQNALEPFYYSEPLFISTGETGAEMMTNGGTHYIGLAYPAVGIITVTLLAEHPTRMIATRTLMLYYDDRPGNKYIPGVMIRYSDDRIRPVASQILAVRYDGDFQDLEAFIEADDAHEAHKIKEDDPLFEACAAFDLDSHAKALGREDFMAALRMFNGEEGSSQPE